MTDEELDLLASSYLDGEATPEEVALVERDPTLRARVEILRNAQATLQAPTMAAPDLREQQLAAALAVFDESGAADRRAPLAAVDPPPADSGDPAGDLPPATPDSVIDLRSEREERTRERDRWQWLSAAAAAAVLLVGGVFLAGQIGSDNDFEAAINAADESDASDDSADDEAVAESAGEANALAQPAAGDDVATDTADADTADRAAMESEAMAPDAEEDFALDESADATADSAEESEEAADDGGGGILPPVFRDDVPESGFFPDEPVATYPSIPTSDEIINDLSLPWRKPDTAQCLGQVPLSVDNELIAYLPIEVTLADGSMAEVEALYLVIGNGAQIVLVDPESCQVL